VRAEVDKWRALKNPNDWRVTPETARLLQHWRHHEFSGVRPFFCQVEAVETAIWLTEVVPQIGKVGQEWFNGKAYYRLHGQELANLPASVSERPNQAFLRWHNENRYQH
jgi:hypothetical protein